MSTEPWAYQWHEYLDHLGTKTEDGTWPTRSDELFTNLPAAMAEDVGYSFDRVQLKKGAYSPIGHGEQEQLLLSIRQSVGEVLSGKRPLKMEVTDFPFSQEATDAQTTLHEKLSNALTDAGSLRVEVIEPKPADGGGVPAG